MRLTRMCDYAVIVLAELARRPDEALSATAAAAGARLPQPTVRKLLKELARAGLVSSERGATGGYRLGRRPEAIRLPEIIEVFEGPVAVTACGANPTACDCSELCGTRTAWALINATLRRSLDQFTLADMLDPGRTDRAASRRRSPLQAKVCPSPAHGGATGTGPPTKPAQRTLHPLDARHHGQ